MAMRNRKKRTSMVLSFLKSSSLLSLASFSARSVWYLMRSSLATRSFSMLKRLSVSTLYCLLDVINEKKIVEALNSAFHQRTVIVVAHRLSTIMNADQIVVLHQGHIVEVGNHQTLMEKKGFYYNLVSAQM